MALFIAVAPQGLQENTELVRLVSKLKRTLNEKGKEVKWVPPDLWHINLQYVGNLEDDARTKLIDFFESWQPPAEFLEIVLRVQGIGAFPSTDHARVLWIGIQKSQPLLDGQAALDRSLADFGFPRDDRNYTPHLTIARFRNPLHAGSLIQLGGRKHFGDYPLEEVILFNSVLQGNTLKYIPIVRKKIRRD